MRRFLLAGLVLAAAAGPLASIATGKPVVADAAWADSLPKLMTSLAGGLAVWAMSFQIGSGVLPRWRKKVLGFDRFWPRPFFTVPRLVVSLVGFAAVLVTVVPTILLQCGAVLLLPVYYAGLRAVRRPGPARTLRTARDCGLVAFASLAFFPGAASLAGAAATTLLLAALLPRLMEDLDRPRRSEAPAPSLAGRRTRTLWAMPAVAALSALLFVGFPRFTEAPPEGSAAGPARRERRDPGTRPAPPGTGTVSVPRRVSIGDIGRLQQDMRPFLEATVLRGGRPADAEDLGALFRSGALEEFDGTTWESPAAAARHLRDAGDGARDGFVTLPPRRLPPGERVEQRIRYLVDGYDPLFCLGMPISVGGDGARGGILLVGRGEVRAPSPFPEGTTVAIRSVVAKGEYPVVDAEAPDEDRLAALVEVPPGHDRAAGLARGEFGGPAPATGTALLRKMERFLARRCRYSLDIAPTGGASPVDAFLFQSRRGHCELFASSAAVMLRSLGVPARVVIGFRGGVLDPATKRYVFRGADAHAWVEAWFDGQGWRSFDPTPPAPAEEREAAAAPPADGDGDEGPSRSLAERILAFDAAAQRRLVLDAVNLAASTARNTFLDGAGRPRWSVFAALAAAVALLAVALLRGPRVAAPPAPAEPARAAPPPQPEAWRVLVDRLAAAGVRRTPSETGLELASRAEASGIGPGEAIRRLAAAYAAERFGGCAPSTGARAGLLALAETVGREVPA